MTDKEKKSGASEGLVMVEKTTAAQHKSYWPMELQEEPTQDSHKRPKAPAIPTVGENFKESLVNKTSDADQTELDNAYEKKTYATKKISSNKRKDSTPEEIEMVLKEDMKSHTTPLPVPEYAESLLPDDASVSPDKNEIKTTDDSITEDVADLRPNEPAKEPSEWSDDEEAGGLPRSESRASRVSRAVRHLFCCGVSYNAPSEEDLPSREFSGI